VPPLHLIPRAELERVAGGVADPDARLSTLADMCRVNALVAVKQAGSGHIGSSFSAMDVVVFLLFEALNTARLGWEHPDRDVYFSSKGHDVPGLYAALFALGIVPRERLLRLRRLGGLDGHPDVGVPGIEANSGSLGMGISKGRGIAWAKRHLGRGGRVVVLVGDGELQEGQNYEGLQAAAHEALAGLTVVVDRNELQSDKRTAEILSLGDLESRFRAFGWHVESCDGHDVSALRAAFGAIGAVDDRPQVVVAHTIKGKGVSFMEHPVALSEGGGTYRWHAGAPDDDAFERAFTELVGRVDERLAELGLAPLELEPVDAVGDRRAGSLEGEPESGAGRARSSTTDEYVVDAYGDELVRLGLEREDLVVLDADLASDCRIRAFELAYPERFVECGIAEQDMVSTAAGLARHGLLPVVNSFASFLAARANEQIYNQASEGSKVVYALHYAGLIPAGPGKSHQSVRDISLLAALPATTVVQPGSSEEARALLRWAVMEAEGNVAVRLAIGPSPRRLELPGLVSPGRGHVLRDGGDALLLAYGPVMLNEALTAAEQLDGHGIGLAVVAMPWLNRFEGGWLDDVLGSHEQVFVLEDHSPVGGLADALRRHQPGRSIVAFGVDGWPACGTPLEALRHHGLDGRSLADRMSARLGARAGR
jgi:transketolase